MSYSGQTIITYTGTTLPTSGVAATLFNSVTAFPPGGSFHLLGQQWFQYTLLTDGAAGTLTGVVTGAFSNDKGATWTTFYTTAAIDDDLVVEDEVYVGMFKDVRFQYTASNENTTVFNINMALNCNKATSKVPANARLVDSGLTLT